MDMKQIAFVALLFVLVFPGTALACEDDYITRTEVKYIGVVCQVGDPEALFRSLAQKPQKAICALVKQLNSTREQEVAPQDWERKIQAKTQVWRIRALRFLTCGLDFTATIPYRPNTKKDPEDYWYWVGGEGTWKMKPGAPVEASFFHTWMSRDIDFIAPVEAQKDIIRQWREWLVTNGTNTGCTPDPKDYNQWYF